jgi:casein kinase II subunit beta
VRFGLHRSRTDRPDGTFVESPGAFFGTTFPHLLFQTFKELLPQQSNSRSSSSSPAPSRGQAPAPPPPTTPLTSATKVYVPRIYGFRVSERARSGPRMQWLRMRPRDESELDSVDFAGKWKISESGGGEDGEGLEEGDEVADLEEDEEEDDDDRGLGKNPADGSNTRRTTANTTKPRSRGAAGVSRWRKAPLAALSNSQQVQATVC